MTIEPPPRFKRDAQPVDACAQTAFPLHFSVEADVQRGRRLILIALLASCAPAKPFTVVDGERVVVNGHHLRLHGVDAPNGARPACSAEAEAAMRAEARLAQMLAEAKAIEFRKTGMACLQWASCDAFVRVDGVDVSDTLIAQGFVARKVIEGDGNKPHDWCAAPATGATP